LSPSASQKDPTLLSFQITCTLGDGICCNHGSGNYTITYGDDDFTPVEPFTGDAQETLLQKLEPTVSPAPTPEPAPCSGNVFELYLVLDNWPEEMLVWLFNSKDSSIVVKEDPYGDFPKGSTVYRSFCLPESSYTFLIIDTYGDGICCSVGKGLYMLTFGGVDFLPSAPFTGVTQETLLELAAPWYFACFSSTSVVQVKGEGTKLMKDLQIGDLVLAKEGTSTIYSEVYSFGHFAPN